MRTYTMLLSVIAHAIAVAAIFVAPIVATGELPEPRRAVEYVVVQPAAPPPPPAPPRAEQPPPAVSADAAPLVEPTDIQPEVARPPVDDLFPGAMTDVGGIVIGDAAAVPAAPPPPPPPPARADPVRVGGAIRPPQKVADVRPEYPEIARRARVAGVVILEAVIGEDGAVRDARVLRSVPLLDDAALAAVRQWRFTPTLLNGEAVPVVMTVTVAFNLN